MPDALKFQGIASATLDDKGRVALPARHREIIAAVSDGAVAVTASPYDPCLYLYPRPAWEILRDELEELPNRRTTVRRIQQVVIGQAAALELDGSGRLLLSAKLREWGELKKKLCLVGLGEKVEIWDDGNWNNTMQSFRDTVKENEGGPLTEVKELEGLSI